MYNLMKDVCEGRLTVLVIPSLSRKPHRSRRESYSKSSSNRRSWALFLSSLSSSFFVLHVNDIQPARSYVRFFFFVCTGCQLFWTMGWWRSCEASDHGRRRRRRRPHRSRSSGFIEPLATRPIASISIKKKKSNHLVFGLWSSPPSAHRRPSSHVKTGKRVNPPVDHPSRHVYSPIHSMCMGTL